MRTIGTEAQFIAFLAEDGEVIVRRSDIMAIKPRKRGCALVLRGGMEIDVREDPNTILQMLSYTRDK